MARRGVRSARRGTARAKPPREGLYNQSFYNTGFVYKFHNQVYATRVYRKGAA